MAGYSLEDAQREFIERAIQFAEIMSYYGAAVKFHFYFRTWEEQNKLFQAGKTKARGGESAHNYGLAADFHFEKGGFDVPDSWWEFADKVARYVGLDTLFSIGDKDHIQLKGWRAWKM